jgi:RNA polymerase sigma factor (sigma-70 family)
MPTADDLLPFLPRMERVAKKLIGPAAPYADVRDLVQDAFVACLRALDRYDGRSSLSTFLFVRINGAMVDALRVREDRRREHPTFRSLDAPHPPVLVSERASPETLTLDRDLVRHALTIGIAYVVCIWTTSITRWWPVNWASRPRL